MLVQVIEACRQCHLSRTVVMAITFPIGGDMDKLWRFDVFKGIGDRFGKVDAIVEDAFEGYILGNAAVVKKQVDAFARRQFAQVSPAWINAIGGNVFPGFGANFANGFALAGCKHRENNPVFSQYFQGFGIGGGFREPHPFWLAAKTGFKIADSPNDLGLFVAAIGQGQNQMPICLSHGGTTPPSNCSALFVGLNDGLISGRICFFHPGKQSWTKIETDPGVIVDDVDDLLVVVQQAGCGIGGVAFKVDAVVPIVEWGCGVLSFHAFQPGIFTRRLVKMSVDAHVFFFFHCLVWVEY